MLLREPRGRSTARLLIALGFVAVGVAMVIIDPDVPRRNAVFIGWVTAIVFGFFALIAAAVVIVPGQLMIDSNAICVRRLGRRREYALARCSRFDVITVGRQPFVVFDYEGGTRKSRWVRRTQQGRTDSLPSSFGFEPVALAALLNRLRVEARTAVRATPRRS